jgi:hypothetical protein
MSRRALLFIVFAILPVFLAGCYKPTQRVIQGKLISYDAKKRVMIIDDELTKDVDAVAVYMGDLREEGFPPMEGMIRVSYNVKDGKNVALRLVDLERAMKLFKIKK